MLGKKKNSKLRENYWKLTEPADFAGAERIRPNNPVSLWLALNPTTPKWSGHAEERALNKGELLPPYLTLGPSPATFWSTANAMASFRFLRLVPSTARPTEANSELRSLRISPPTYLDGVSLVSLSETFNEQANDSIYERGTPLPTTAHLDPVK